MEASRFNEAVRALNEAAQAAPDLGVIYFLRAQARAGAHDVTGTFADVQKFEQLADSQEEREAAQRLKSALFGSSF
jgi:hypothetical protein